MSTRNKGKKSTLNPWGFVARRNHMDDIRAHIMLHLHLFRAAMANKEGVEDHWVEVAAFINIAVMFALERKREDWQRYLAPGVNAMRACLERHERVGGRWALKPEEEQDVMSAITCLDEDILPVITQPEYIRIAVQLNNLKQGELK